MDTTIPPDETRQLKEELEKVRSQFNIFYTLTKVMRTTLHLDDAAYIILTGLTAHQGLGFNRAFLFLTDRAKKELRGFMGIGPVDGSEAQNIWNMIEAQQMDLQALIKNHRGIKEGTVHPRLMGLTRSILIPLDGKSGLAHDTLQSAAPAAVTEEMIRERYADDPIVARLGLRHFAAAALPSPGGPLGMILVDNLVTGKSISAEDLRIFSMFVDQASGAIENCQEYESTLFKAHTDSLTTLWNHGYFQWQLDEELAGCSKEGAPLSVLLADIDNFKKFNDSFGHQVGDEAIRLIAGTLKSCAGEAGIACRYGGEEFALIMPKTWPEEAMALAERFRAAVERISLFNVPVTVSIGVADFPRDASLKQELVHKADLALYLAKSQGKNRVFHA